MHFKEYKSVLSSHNGMNLYRGCTHGCIYCDSRSACYRMDHAFEDIEVKRDAPQLLERELAKKREKCMIGTGSMSDPYLPAERELRYTRRCLEIIAERGFGVSILTKSDLILRDLDLLTVIAQNAKCVVQMTLTTYDETLCGILEPNVAPTRRRAEALRVLRDCGIPTVVWLCPILPWINDTRENLDGILELCLDAKVGGIVNFGFGLTLREGNREYFYACLDRSFPGLRQRYIRRYGNAYEIESENAAALTAHLRQFCGANGIVCDNEQIFAYLASFPRRARQLSFF